MPICQYFLKGTCRFGNSCRNEHPRDGDRQSGFANQSWHSGSHSNAITVPYSVESIGNDLKQGGDKPMWPLSSYGPAKHIPTLIGGLDESPEELRVKAVLALKSGNTAEYTKYESDKIAAAEQVFAQARPNVQQLFNQATGHHPTASPSTVGGTGNSPFGSNSTFGTSGSTAASSFGKPSGFGAFANTAPSPFGSGSTVTSAFGNSSFGKQPQAFGSPATNSAFGQPAQTSSAFGQSPQPPSAFGQPSKPTSVFGQPPQTTSAFAQTSQPVSAFGQTVQPASTFSQPSTSTSVFGQSSQPTSAFGQQAHSTSAFGATAQPTSAFSSSTSPFSQAAPATSAFGQSSFGGPAIVKPATGAFGSSTASGFQATGNPPQSSTTGGSGGGFSAFSGQPASFGLGAANNVPASTAASGFGQAAFGAPSFGSTAAPSGFGAPSAFGVMAQNQSSATSAFGPPVQPPSGFGTTTNSTPTFGSLNNNTASAFGTVQPQSAFGSISASQPQSAFGSASQGPMSASTFGAPVPSVSAFGTPSQATNHGSGTGNQQSISAFSTASKAPPNTIMKDGKPDFDAALSIVRAKPGLDKYDALLPDNYLEIIPKKAREAFEARRFEWGNIPEWIPPKELR